MTTARKTQDEKQDAQPQERAPKYPKRLWLAGPAPYVAQETILVPKSQERLVFYNGALVVHNAEQEAAVRKAMGNRVFDEDRKTPIDHPRSGWSTLSQEAFNAHVRVVER